MSALKFSLDKTYYQQPTLVFNLPAGWSCPWATACYTKADRETGKLTTRPDKDTEGKPQPTVDGVETYVCYAARAERFPGVRDARWGNFDTVRAMVQDNQPIELPEGTTHVRVHGSGDFYSQDYFDWWLQQARNYPDVQFWAFTKSLRYWVERLGDIPANFALTASTGGKEDHLIEEHDLKSTTVYHDIDDVPAWVMIDIDDAEAQDSSRPSFALLENLTNKAQGTDERIAHHNRMAATLTTPIG